MPPACHALCRECRPERAQEDPRSASSGSISHIQAAPGGKPATFQVRRVIRILCHFFAHMRIGAILRAGCCIRSTVNDLGQGPKAFHTPRDPGPATICFGSRYNLLRRPQSLNTRKRLFFMNLQLFDLWPGWARNEPDGAGSASRNRKRRPPTRISWPNCC